MGSYTVYRLKFKTQLHLGRRSGPAQAGSLGLEKTETYIPADTLFSAICQTWTTYYDTESLSTFLNGYTEDKETLPFTLTSAFPFVHDYYLFPKPLIWTNKSKQSKRIQFVSNSIFQNIITGNPDKFDEENICNGNSVWVSAAEREQLNNLMNDKTVIWDTNTRPRVTIGSLNAGSEIWHIQTVQYYKNCGLWFAAEFDSDETQQKIETILRVLGDTGIGGERNAGYGLFDYETSSIEIPDAKIGNQFVTLSPICPKSSGELQQLLTGEIAYNLNSIGGWIGSTGSERRRKQINMFSEGSVLHNSEHKLGSLVDLRPDNYVHPVFRYGYAWQVGIKGVSNETEVST